MKKAVTRTITFLKEPANLAQMAFYFVTAVLFVYATFGDHGIIKLHKYFTIKRVLAAENIKLKDDIEDLYKKRLLLTSPKYLEIMVREELGFVRPDETIFEWLKK